MLIIKTFSADNLDELEEMTNTYLKFMQRNEFVESRTLYDESQWTIAIISTSEPLGYKEALLDKDNATIKGLSEIFQPTSFGRAVDLSKGKEDGT